MSCDGDAQSPVALSSGMADIFKKHTLDNGLTIIAEIMPEAHTAAAGFFVRTGARDEDAALMGVSHFLEHMMFKGTKDIAADELNQCFDRIGARNNAYTSSELTCFFAQVLPEYLEDGLDTLSRMMRPALRQDDFDTEKNVILEEIAMYNDNPFWVLYEATMEKHYQEHPLAHRVLGTNQTVSDLTRDQMQQYFDNRYAADNTVVVLAGRLDFDKAVQQVSKLCSTWQTTGVDRAFPSIQHEPCALKMQRKTVNRGYLLMLAPGPALQDDARYAMMLLMQVLGGSDNSRLHWKLIETGLAEEAMAGYEAHDGSGDCYVYASGEPSQLGEFQKVIEQELRELVDSIREDDLIKLRSKLATAVTIESEKPNDCMQRMGRLWTYTGEYRSLADELKQINAVSVADLHKVSERFPLSTWTVGTLEPE